MIGRPVKSFIATTREKILTAADLVFGEEGFDAATTRRIAEQCGVNKALLHYHFSSKHHLFGAVLDSYYEQLNGVLARELATEGTGRDRFARVLDAYVDFLGANQSFSRMVQREASGGKHLERVVGHMLPVFRSAIEMLAHEYPQTRSGDLSGPHLLISFYGMIVSYFTYAPVLEGLWGEAPLAAPSMEQRKRHLHRMLDLVVSELERHDS